jgi:hypothetical protein
MDHPDDPPTVDPQRLARWSAGPAPRRVRQRDPSAIPRDVIAAHGGEVAFWLAWLRGELDADLQAWFRRQAETDATLRADLRSIEQPHASGYSTHAARADLRNALEAVHYLTESAGSDAPHLPASFAFQEDAVQTETDLVLSEYGKDAHSVSVREVNQSELRRRIRSGLFALLEEIEIHVPAAEEAGEGTRLLEHLAGLPAMSKFLHLHQLQSRSATDPPSLRDRLLRELAPELYVRDGERLRYRLSFRLFLRSRLQHSCRQRGWLPAGPRFRDLPSAFAALSRERIGTLVRGLLAARDVFQPAGIPCQQLGALLDTMP